MVLVVMVLVRGDVAGVEVLVWIALDLCLVLRQLAAVTLIIVRGGR
jgi:hypothetical protein